MTVTRPPFVFAGVHPHPPIAVAEVAGDRLAECRSTHDACRRFVRRLLETRPDRVLVLSPHAPRSRDGFDVVGGARLRGDLGAFRTPEAAVDLPADTEMDAALQSAAASTMSTMSTGGTVGRIPADAPLDHGAVVPLLFLARAGWEGRTCVTSIPLAPRPDVLEAFGKATRAAAAAVGGGVALVASGDMTHRATPDAPAGFHEDAVRFDETLVGLVADGRLAEIREIDPRLRAIAAEDVVDTSIVAASAIEPQTSRGEVLSYEHPFGVGYLVAIFLEALDA